MPTEKPRVSITITDELLEAIEDYRFDNRFQTRTQAVHAIIRAGLIKLKEESAEKIKIKKMAN